MDADLGFPIKTHQAEHLFYNALPTGGEAWVKGAGGRGGGDRTGQRPRHQRQSRAKAAYSWEKMGHVGIRDGGVKKKKTRDRIPNLFSVLGL